VIILWDSVPACKLEYNEPPFDTLQELKQYLFSFPSTFIFHLIFERALEVVRKAAANLILLFTILRSVYPLKQAKVNIGKHKIDDAVTVDKKHSNNDIQGPEEEDSKQQSTTNTVF
jgi:hypothetical protein